MREFEIIDVRHEAIKQRGLSEALYQIAITLWMVGCWPLATSLWHRYCLPRWVTGNSLDAGWRQAVCADRLIGHSAPTRILSGRWGSAFKRTVFWLVSDGAPDDGGWSVREFSPDGAIEG